MVSRNFARRLSIPVVLGFEEQLAGTLIDYVGLEGHVAVGFEGGQHQDPQSVDHLEAIVWIALGELGLVDVEAAWLQAERDKLVRASAGAPAILEMTYRHAITGDDAFSMLPGFASFEPVTAGQTVAVDARGDVTAPKGGYLLMPVVRKNKIGRSSRQREFADRVAPTKSVRTHVSSSRSLRGVQTAGSGLECRRLEDVGSAASESSPGQAARANR